MSRETLTARQRLIFAAAAPMNAPGSAYVAAVLDALLAHPEELVAALVETGALEDAGYQDVFNDGTLASMIYPNQVVETMPRLLRVSSRLPTEAPKRV